MKYIYNKKERILSIYAKPNENPMVSTAGDLKVLERKFESENDIKEFLCDFTVLVQHVFGHMYDNDEIIDIVVLGTAPHKKVTWWSLTDTEETGISHNVFDLLMDYGFNNFEKAMPFGETLNKMLSPRDQAKLNLAALLVKSIRVGTRKRENLQKLDKKVNILKKRLAAFEQKHGFSSELMYKYYSDDEMPEGDVAAWLALYEDYRLFKNMVTETTEMEVLTDEWLKTFEKTDI